MLTFLTYLWKEWRDARAVVIGFAIAIPVLLLILAFTLPYKVVASEVFSSVVALGCFGIALMSLGSDLVPGEARRGRLDFLRRLPANLLAPFLAKLVFFTLSLTLFTVYGWLAACLVGEFPAEIKAWHYAGTAAVLAPWVFAVSCWLPRGALALPAAGMLLALFGLPLFFIHLAWPYVRPNGADAIAFGCLLLFGAVAVAGVSFVRGYRFGRGIGAASWRGLVLTAVLFLPTYAYAGYRVHEWHALDVKDRSFTIHDGHVDTTGRYAYVNCNVNVRGNKGPMHPLRIDLHDGSFSALGRPGDMVFDAHVARGKPAKVVSLRDMKASGIDHWVHFIDATTGETFKSGWSHMRWPEVEERLGRDRSVVPEGWRHFWPSGHGYSLWKVGKAAYYDPARDKTYERDKEHSTVIVRRGRWLVRRSMNADWLLWDPDTKETAPAQGMLRRMAWVLLEDARVLVISKKDGVYVVDPETGERHNVEGDIKDAWSIGQTPRGAPILTVKRPDDTLVLARFDPETHALRYVASLPYTNYFSFRLLAAVDENTLVGVYNGRRIVRVRFDDESTEYLFPNRFKVDRARAR